VNRVMSVFSQILQLFSRLDFEKVRIPAYVGRPFRSMPAGHSGGCRPPVPAQAGHPMEQKVTLDSPRLGVPSCEPIPGGTLWRLSDYPCERHVRFSA
jgi:hypothetical protein